MDYFERIMGPGRGVDEIMRLMGTTTYHVEVATPWDRVTRARALGTLALPARRKWHPYPLAIALINRMGG